MKLEITKVIEILYLYAGQRKRFKLTLDLM